MYIIFHLIILTDPDETSLQGFNFFLLGSQLGTEDTPLLLQGAGQSVCLLTKAKVDLLQAGDLLPVLVEAGLAHQQLLLRA